MRRRSWVVAGVVVAMLAAALPMLGVTHTRLGTLQMLYALALVALLVWLVARALANRHSDSRLHGPPS